MSWNQQPNSSSFYGNSQPSAPPQSGPNSNSYQPSNSPHNQYPPQNQYPPNQYQPSNTPNQYQGSQSYNPQYSSPQNQQYGQSYGQQQGGYNNYPPQNNYQPQNQYGNQSYGYNPQQTYGMNPEHAKLKQFFDLVDTDRSGQVSAQELQQALSKVGFEFSVEAAALCVNMFDQDRSRQIGFNEFVNLNKYLIRMKNAFHQVDTDNSGTLDLMEILKAVNSSGYNLSPNGLRIVFAKFDRKNKGSLDFDGYIELCVFLGNIRNVFMRRDINRSGHVTFTLEDLIVESTNIWI